MLALRVNSSCINIDRGVQLWFGAPLQLQHRVRTAAPSSLGVYSSSINIERGQQLRYRVPLQLQHHQARTAVPSSLDAYSSTINIERGQQLRYGAPLQPQHHQARTAVPTASSADSSSGMGWQSSSTITKCIQQLHHHRALSRTWRDRLLGAIAGAALTLATLWLILVSAATATIILRA